MTNDLHLLSKNIKKYISNSSLKSIDISKKLNVSRGTISRWCSGERFPTVQNLFDLAKILKIDVFKFWQDVENPNITHAEKELLRLQKQLTEPQLHSVLEVVKSMLPPPEMEDFFIDIELLDSEERKALMTLVRSRKNQNH